MFLDFEEFWNFCIIILFIYNFYWVKVREKKEWKRLEEGYEYQQRNRRQVVNELSYRTHIVLLTAKPKNCKILKKTEIYKSPFIVGIKRIHWFQYNYWQEMGKLISPHNFPLFMLAIIFTAFQRFHCFFVYKKKEKKKLWDSTFLQKNNFDATLKEENQSISKLFWCKHD